MASAPISTADLSNRPKGWRPTPMIATSLVTGLSLDRLEGEGDDLVAVSIGRERNHGQFDLHAELQLLRIVLGEPAFDANLVTQLNEADAERHEILARGSCIRCAGREPLRSPRDHRAA